MNQSSVQTFGYLQTHMNLIMCFLFNGFLGFAKISEAALFLLNSAADGGGWVACRLSEFRVHDKFNIGQILTEI